MTGPTGATGVAGPAGNTGATGIQVGEKLLSGIIGYKSNYSGLTFSWDLEYLRDFLQDSNS